MVQYVAYTLQQKSHVQRACRLSVQTINWEDKAASDEERTSITAARALTDKVLIGGIEQHHDFHNIDKDRESIKAVLKNRLISS